VHKGIRRKNGPTEIACALPYEKAEQVSHRWSRVTCSKCLKKRRTHVKSEMLP
jgi:hypothetical protein